MSTTEARAELELRPGHPGGRGVHVLQPRLVPLGGPRAMTVRRTLPHRDRSLVGAWCFVDHYGPDEVAVTGGMNVPPHPHAGPQTVSWLFDGEIEHRDSGGAHALVRPGEVNLMTGGLGIAHSEVSTPATTTLRGAQLWVALPGSHRQAARDFQHYRAPLASLVPGVRGRVFIGSLAGQSAPVRTFAPLVGAELHLDAGASCTLAVAPGYEHALLADQGEASFCGAGLTAGQLGVTDAGRQQLTIAARRATRALLLGGAPFDEEIVMWWNFIAATHEEICGLREQWQRHSARFGEVSGYAAPRSRLAAPPLPGVRLRPRGRSGHPPPA